MSIYRRLARSKKGMSTIFGGLFFVILLLMGFNVMLWGFVQFDAYNRVIANMSQRDQQAIGEDILPVNSTYGSGLFNIWVDNLGGSSVSIAQVYISNVNTTGNCQPTPCYAPLSYAFSGGNIPAGSVNYPIQVSGFTPTAGTQYHITLASTRGRLFTLYYPWKFNSLTINNNGGGAFVTNIGPLSIFFDYRSFNYTQGTQTVSQSAFCMPASTPVILYIKIANTVTYSDVKLLTQTGLQAQAYGVNGFGQFAHAWIEDNRTVNPSATFAYNFASSPYDLAPAGVNGPTSASYALVKIGASGPGATGAVSFGNSDVSWITFLGFYYEYKPPGSSQYVAQGQTIPFMDFVTNSPNCIA